MQITFKCTAGEFYDTYFAAKQEKEKIRELAKAFMEKHSLPVNTWCLSERLRVSFQQNHWQEYANQLMKSKPDKYCLFMFKKNSALSKAWKEEVWCHADAGLLNKAKFWWLPCVDAGRFSTSLWDHNGVIYGLLECQGESNMRIPEGVEAIKLSEYYTVLEESENG